MQVCTSTINKYPPLCRTIAFLVLFSNTLEDTSRLPTKRRTLVFFKCNHVTPALHQPSMPPVPLSHDSLILDRLGLLAHDLIARGGDPQLVGRDERLGVHPQPLEHVHEPDGKEHPRERPEPAVRLALGIDERPLMSPDGRVGRVGDDESRGLHGPLDLGVVDRIDRADEGHGLLDVIDVLLVVRVVVVQEDPVEVGELGPRLEEAEDLLEQRDLVLGVREGLDVVRRVELLVGVRERIVDRTHLEVGPLLQPDHRGVFLRVGDLGRVDVHPAHGRAGRAGRVHGDASPSASDVEDPLVGLLPVRLDEYVLHHLELVQFLIGAEPDLGVAEGGDVHLLDVAQGAEVIDDMVVVDDVILVLAVVVGPIPVEEHVGREEGVDGLLVDGGEGVQGVCSGADAVRVDADDVQDRVERRVREARDCADGFGGDDGHGDGLLSEGG
mmetsp:Transcript_27901/g.81964  ORF Transcript_27901/g.81964 Transcript_27901/m.81964 type:complete len:440 (-) Transcript_27901:138-1457(-)